MTFFAPRGGGEGAGRETCEQASNGGSESARAKRPTSLPVEGAARALKASEVSEGLRPTLGARGQGADWSRLHGHLFTTPCLTG